MIKRINELYKTFININKEYHIGIMVASNTFYLIMLIIPLNGIGFNFSNLNLQSIFDIFTWGILFLINLVFVASKYFTSLRMTSDLIYDKAPIRKKLNEYLKSLVMTIILLIVGCSIIIISYGLIDVWTNVFNSNSYWIFKILESIVSFSIICLIITIIFKYTIPIPISYKETSKFSIIITLIWLILSTIYQNLNIYLNNLGINESFKTIVFIYWLYLSNYLLVFAFICNYYHYKKSINSDRM